MDQEKRNIRYAKKIAFILTIILAFKILGYFTLNENIVITRGLKILIRLSMTLWVLQVYKGLKRKGNVPSFNYRHVLAPFLYGGYLFLGFASLLWSTKVGYSALQLTMNIESFIFVYLFLRTFILLRAYYPEVTLRLSAQFGPAVAMIMLYFVIGKYTDPDKFFRLTHGGEVARLGGYMMNPNELGMLAVVGIACNFIELIHDPNRWKKAFQITMVLLSLYALVLTGSRSSMIGFMLVLLYFIQKSDNAKLKMAVYVGAVLSVPVIIQTIFIKQGDLEEVMSMTGRLPFWTALLTEGLPKEPIWGFGYMRIAYTDAFQSVNTYAGKMTHNTFIQVLMNLGFTGFFIVVVQMAANIRAFVLSQNTIDNAFFVGLFIPIIINSFTEFGIFGETNYGIIFYQFLIWLYVINHHERLDLKSKVRLKKLRPDFYEKYYVLPVNKALQ